MAKKTERKVRAAEPKPARQDRAASAAAQVQGETGRQEPRAGGDAVKKRVVWLSALILIVSGYSLLHKVDPGGQNAWAIVSPALLLAGYLLIIPAILLTYREG